MVLAFLYKCVDDVIMIVVKTKALFVFIATLVLFVATSHKTFAATCSTTGSLGVLNYSINVPVAGEYIIWTRMLAPNDTDTTVYVEVNNNTCYQIGSQIIPNNIWTWVNYQGNSVSNKARYTFNNPGDYDIKIIGSRAGVQVDKILMLGSGESCSSNGNIPLDKGDNCDAGIVVSTESTDPVAPQTSPATITPSIVSQTNPEEIATVEYFVDGELVQSETAPKSFDTGLIGNGTYTLKTTVTKKDGSVETEESLIEVQNEDSNELLNSLQRYKTPLIGLFALVGVVSLITGTMHIFKIRHNRRIFNEHHGLSGGTYGGL